MRPRRPLIPLVAAAAVCAGIAAPAASTASGSADHRSAGRGYLQWIDPAAGIANLDHLVFIVQENRSFDHYFGTFPGANGIPRNADGSLKPCLPDPEATHCRRPWHDTGPFDKGAPHNRAASIMAVNGGKMNGFVRVLREMKEPCSNRPDHPHCVRAAGDEQGRPDVMGYHTAKELPNYWAYAKRYLLQDRMFAPTDSWTLPAHLYLVSAWSARCTELSTPDPDASSCVTDLERPDQHWRPFVGDPDEAPYRWADITWLMHEHDVSWRYYVGPGTCLAEDCDMTLERGTVFGKNPLLGFRTVAATGQMGNIQHYGSFFNAAANGTLPSVSWIVPYNQNSEHPTHPISAGQAWVTRAVNAIMEGPRSQWMRTAIFVVWDDWGGFYDHVPPKWIDPYGYGIRVPAFVISPWVKRGLDVDHQTLSFDAYLKLIEDRFMGGQRLDGKNMGWPDPRPTVRENLVPGDLRSIFDFRQDPIPRLVLDTRPS
jgi:phospholipase C